MRSLLGAPTPAQRLVGYWAGLGCTLAPAVSSQQIAEFERRDHIRLPSDLREYVSLCNGLSHDAGGQWDRDDLGLIEFWPLDRWSVLREPLPDHLGLSTSYFMFADFLLSSHEYGIRLTDDPGDSGSVIAYGGPAAVVAPSFSAFIAAYLEEPDRVLSPW